MVVPAAAITAAQRALTNPATSRFLATGLQRASTAAGNGNSASAGAGASGANANAVTISPAQAAAAASVAAAALPSLVSVASASSSHLAQGSQPGENGRENVQGVNVGRVAAAAQAFSAAPPKAANMPAHGTHKRTESGRLVAQKKFGDVDVSSAGAMFRSLRGSTAAKNAPPPPVQTPPAFSGTGGKKASSAFAPPPVRRIPSSSSAAAPTPAPEPEFVEDAQPEAGEWAEALYDYTSEEAGDLHLRAGERVLVTEQTSSDWWTGEVDGRSGLFPATYVKLL